MQFAVFLLDAKLFSLQIIDPLFPLFSTSLSSCSVSFQKLSPLFVNVSSKFARISFSGVVGSRGGDVIRALRL